MSSKRSIVSKILGLAGLLHFLPDELAIKLLFKGRVGYWPNLRDPQTFNEKLQWLKLYDRNPLYATLVDKYSVKQWVAERIGAEHVTRTYARWNDVNDLDISKLPNKFVLKTNHDSGGVVVCKDGSAFDLELARKKLSDHLNRNYYWRCREWPYKNVEPCIFAEEYIEPTLVDESCNRALFTFSDGRIVTQLAPGRFAQAGLTDAFFDEEWHQIDLAEGERSLMSVVAVSSRYKEAKKFVNGLAETFPLERSEYYESSNKLLFVEVKIRPKAGFDKFDPERWDSELGSWVKLPYGNWVLAGRDFLLWAHEGGAVSRAVLRDEIIDYKFYCFGGEPKLLYVSQGLENHATAQISFLNLDWTFAPFRRSDYAPFELLPQKPACYEEMLSLAQELSQGMPFVRVDFFESAGAARFSEMTFSPCGGCMPFFPGEWDQTLGSLVDLSGAYGS